MLSASSRAQRPAPRACHGGPMFRHVLVPLDGTVGAEIAIPVAKAIAERFSALVTLMDVSPGVPGGITSIAEAFGASGSTGEATAREAAAEAAIPAYLDAVIAAQGEPGWGAAMGEGDPA